MLGCQVLMAVCALEAACWCHCKVQRAPHWQWAPLRGAGCLGAAHKPPPHDRYLKGSGGDSPNDCGAETNLDNPPQHQVDWKERPRLLFLGPKK